MKQNGKVFLVFAIFIYMALPTFGRGVSELSLYENAAQTAANNIVSSVNSGSIAVVRISSQDTNLSQQIIQWLENGLVAGRILTTISREKINDVLKEQRLGLSGLIDDESAQRIGHLLGAEYVLAGDIKNLNGTSILNIQVLETETGRLLYSDSFSIKDGAKPPQPLPYIGQFEVGGWFSFNNITGANNGGLSFDIEPYIAFSRSFSDRFSLNMRLGNYSRILTGDTAKSWTNIDLSPIKDWLYLSITPRLSLPIGPGTLRLSLQLMPIFYLADNYDFFGEYYSRDMPPTFIFNPAIRYSLHSGLGWLNFELYTDNMGIAKGYDYDKDTKEYKYGLLIKHLKFFAEVYNLLGSGIALSLTPSFFIKTNDSLFDSYFHNLRFGMGYYGLDNFNFGLRADFPIGTKINKTAMEYRGIDLIPFVQAKCGAFSTRLNFYVYYIGANTDYRKVSYSAQINVSYSFSVGKR
ncbi:MAG: CsgG/HfaB family protein [Treponema sp.]|jgi:TolB-like protein|nr:CsgG/HfaB family protein [Treponema sp.]